MGKTSGSRKAKVLKNSKKLDQVPEMEGISAENEVIEDQVDSIETVEIAPRKRIRKGNHQNEAENDTMIQEEEQNAKVIEDDVQNDVDVFQNETIPADQDEQVQVESNPVIPPPASPKSILLAFRREIPPEEDIQMQSTAPIMTSSIPSVAAINEPQMMAAENQTDAPSSSSIVQVAPSILSDSLARPIARDTIDYYKQSVSSLTKENESLKALVTQVQDLLKQSQVGFQEYKVVHEKKVSELMKTVDMLSEERRLFTVALQNEESQDGGVSLAHYQSLVSQMEKMKCESIDRENVLQTTKQTLSLFQKQNGDLNEQVEALKKEDEETKETLKSVSTERDGLVVQLASQTELVSSQTVQFKKIQEAYEKSRLENGHLQSLIVQTQSQLAAFEAEKTVTDSQEKLAHQLKEEIIFSATLEKMVDVYEKMTGLKVQNVESVLRTAIDDETEGVQHEYSQFTIKHKGSFKNLIYKLCVPREKHLKTAYIPIQSQSTPLPGWLSEEMEFDGGMIRLFFCNLMAFLNGNGNQMDAMMDPYPEDGIVGMMP